MNKIDLKNIIKKFLNQFLQKHTNVEIEGVLVFGSVLREKYFFERSDVDVYIVIKNNKRYRGIKVVDGVEIDYFVNPIEQLQKEFEIAKKLV